MICSQGIVGLKILPLVVSAFEYGQLPAGDSGVRVAPGQNVQLLPFF